MKLFCFSCRFCDADYLRKDSEASLCPHCKKLLILEGIFEVYGDPEYFLESDKEEWKKS